MVLQLGVVRYCSVVVVKAVCLCVFKIEQLEDLFLSLVFDLNRLSILISCETQGLVISGRTPFPLLTLTPA
jgi:hypothetical protein